MYSAEKVIPGLRIREATSADSESISRLLIALAEKFVTVDFAPEAREALLRTMTPEAVSGFFESGYRYHVAELDKRIVGVVSVRGNSHLYHLFVAEEFHRQGVAKKLWQIALKASLREGSPDEFTVNSSEYATAVYESFGFVSYLRTQEKDGIIFVPMKLSLAGLK